MEKEKDLLSKHELCLGNYSHPGPRDEADISLLADGRAAWISSSCGAGSLALKLAHVAPGGKRLLMLCWGLEEDQAGVWGGACLGMPHNIHLRGRYLLKFQLAREMAEAERGLAFAVQRGAVFLPWGNVSDRSRGKKQWRWAASASLQGKPGKVNPKWGCAAGLTYFTTSAAATARF